MLANVGVLVAFEAGTWSVLLVKSTIQLKQLRCNGVNGNSYELYEREFGGPRSSRNTLVSLENL